LLLTTSENDIRLKALQFRTSVLRSRLSKASARLREPSCRTTDLIEGLEELYEVARGLQRRDWSQEQIESTPYSEASMLEFRRLTLHEQVISKTIQAEVQSVLLDDAEAELARLDIVS
jgi:hypothetical protein